MTRDPWRTHEACARTLSRFLAPAAQPFAEIHHSRALPTRVTLRPHTYHVSRRFPPSADSLVSFQPGALTGRYPSELYLTEIANASRLTSPPAISEPTVGQTLGLLCFTPPQELAVTRTSSSNKPVKICPFSDQWCLALSARRHCCRSGLASGVLSLCRLGRTVAGFLHVRRPWLSWAFSSLGRSLSEPGPPGYDCGSWFPLPGPG